MARSTPYARSFPDDPLFAEDDPLTVALRARLLDLAGQPMTARNLSALSRAAGLARDLLLQLAAPDARVRSRRSDLVSNSSDMSADAFEVVAPVRGEFVAGQGNKEPALSDLVGILQSLRTGPSPNVALLRALEAQIARQLGIPAIEVAAIEVAGQSPENAGLGNPHGIAAVPPSAEMACTDGDETSENDFCVVA
jgi:hypothetical protein